VVAAVGARLDMVDIEKMRVTTPRDLAAAAIAMDDLSPYRGRDRLGRALARARLDLSSV
jgi:hypothetical protein